MGVIFWGTILQTALKCLRHQPGKVEELKAISRCAYSLGQIAALMQQRSSNNDEGLFGDSDFLCGL